jgi:hypothetical protein
LIIEEGQKSEAKRDPTRAAAKFWSVARFGQVIESQGRTDSEHCLGWELQAGAYKQLQRLAGKEGNTNQAVLFAYLAARFAGSAAAEFRRMGEHWTFGEYVSRRNAAVLQISSLMMMIFGVLMAASLVTLVAGRRGGGNAGAARRVGRVATIGVLAGSVGLLLSFATIYLTYRPYWYIFQRALLNGDRSQTGDLYDFVMALRVLPGLVPRSELTPRLPLYFWAGVTLLGVATLVLILLRQFRGRPSSGGLLKHSRVP